MENLTLSRSEIKALKDLLESVFDLSHPKDLSPKIETIYLKLSKL
jgi:hypothetical protein